MKNISVIAGELAGFFECNGLPVYKYRTELNIEPRDFHFFNNCPLKKKSESALLLFSVLFFTLNRYEMLSHCGFICISLMISVAKLHFMLVICVLLVICVSSLEKCPFKAFAHF